MTDFATQVLHIFWFAVAFTAMMLLGVMGIASLLVPVRTKSESFTAYLLSSLFIFVAAVLLVGCLLLGVTIVQETL